MTDARHISELTSQIQRYVRLIKEKKGGQPVEKFSVTDTFQPQLNNDLRTNINKLDGNNKFSIQKLTEQNTFSAPTEYVAEAYEHLTEINDKKNVIIDYMHKNNRNYDVKA